jgi:transcriptional regulator with XRE-family HTH domain
MDTAVRRFSSRLYNLRMARNLTQEALAARAKLHPGFISTLERGTKIPSLVTVDQVAKGLGVWISALLEDDIETKAGSAIRKEILLIAALLERRDLATVRRIRKAVECLTAT